MDWTEAAGQPDGSGLENLLERESKPKIFVIPACLTVLTPDCIANAASVEVVAFESGSQIRRLESQTFGRCVSLQSICIAASVEFIDRACFLARDQFGEYDPSFSEVETITFEPGSRLREIAPDAFVGCVFLKQICIPASVEKMTGDSFRDCPFSVVAFEDGNPYFEKHGDFMIESKSHRLVLYIGAESELAIPDEIEAIGPSCFGYSLSIRSLGFGPLTRLSSIEPRAFASCANLETITIPSSLRCLGESCFANCSQLKSVSIGRDSLLDRVPRRAFRSCPSLESIILPPCTKILEASCFGACNRLAESPFPADSEVVRIDQSAFSACWSLKSMRLPSLTEFVGELCFCYCDALLDFTFPAPSRIRELLDLPPQLGGFIAIPDSVEILSFHRSGRYLPSRTLRFGRESRLRELRAIGIQDYMATRSFVQVSSRSLKLFRAKLEFE
jgi:hypothetical protein